MVADEGFAGFAVLPLKLQGQNNFKSNNITHGKEKRKCKILVIEGLWLFWLKAFWPYYIAGLGYG